MAPPPHPANTTAPRAPHGFRPRLRRTPTPTRAPTHVAARATPRLQSMRRAFFSNRLLAARRHEAGPRLPLDVLAAAREAGDEAGRGARRRRLALHGGLEAVA